MNTNLNLIALSIRELSVYDYRWALSTSLKRNTFFYIILSYKSVKRAEVTII